MAEALLVDLRVQVHLHMKLYHDNKFATNIANNPAQHDQINHIEINQHFIQEKLDPCEMCLPYILFANQVSNVFTIGLSKDQFVSLLFKWCMIDTYAQLEGEYG